jgi:hypothetical protein
MSLQTRIVWLLFSGLIASALAGCFAATNPEQNDLCLITTTVTPEWSVEGSTERGYFQYPEHLEAFGSTSIIYDLHIRQDFNLEAEAIKKDASTYWVTLWVQRLSSDPELGKSMLYQPDGAWVEINGKRTAASGAAMFSAQDDKPRSIVWPVNLLALTDPIDSLYSSLYIAFPVRWPRGPKDQWIVHLGTVKLGDKVLAIPDYKSRFTPTGAVWVPIFMGS